MLLYKSIYFNIITQEIKVPVDLKELIEDTYRDLHVKSGETLQIESTELKTLKQQKAFVLNRLGRVVYSLFREHSQLPNIYKVGFAFRVYLEILSNGKPKEIKKLKDEFLSGFNDPRHESVRFEEFQKSKNSEL